MFPAWYLIVTALAVQFATASKVCSIWSSAGTVVEKHSSFRIFCTFTVMCERAVYMDNTLRQPIVLNASTVAIDAESITDKATFSCQCMHARSPDPCGVDILAGYPPDKPGALTCVKHVTDVQPDELECSWSSVKETHLSTTHTLWLRSPPGNHTGISVNLTGPSEEAGSFRVRTAVHSSVQTVTGNVYAHNKLGRAESDSHAFTLADIVKPSPPVLIRVDCSSRSCNITWRHSHKTCLEVQYREGPEVGTAERKRFPGPNQDWRTSSSGLPSVHSLEPARQYCFRARARLNTGLWSDWSTTISNRTQEEAPDQELDVWFTFAPVPPKTLTVYWKPLRDSEARGRVLGYWVHHTGQRNPQKVSANATRLSLQPCDPCLVTVSAFNSKGSSPPVHVPSHFKPDQPPQELSVTESRNNVSLYWRTADPTSLPTGYVVEWYLQDQQVDMLRWMRLSSSGSRAVITEMEPFECYDGALYVLYKNSLGKATFTGVNTQVSVPTGAPSVNKQDGGNKVTLTWTQIPRSQRGGCVRNYTVYIGNSKGPERMYHVPPSEHRYTLEGLPPDTYMVQVTAWTAKGEGPRGKNIKFIVHQELILAPVLVIPIALMVLFLLCVLLAYCQRRKILLQNIPDPSNSKWAKAFTDNKATTDLHVDPSGATSDEEQEVLVTVLEHPALDDVDASSVHRHGSDSPPQTPYAKSLSHDSDSSQYTATTTAGYISSQAEEDVVEEEEEEEEGCTDFYPSTVFHDALVFEGGLTLDAVKIDCRSLLENGL